MNRIEINFFCDESGHLHSNSPKRYFVIGGYFCLKEDSNIIKQKYLRALKKIKIKRKMIKSDELKARIMSNNEKIELLEVLQNSKGCNCFAFVIDKNDFSTKIYRENLFYNYFVKLIIDYILIPICNLSYTTDEIVVDMIIDSRNLGYEHLKSLEDYLNSEYLFSRFSFIANYHNSKTDTRVQAADLIANTIYQLFKDPNSLSEVTMHIDTEKIFIYRYPSNTRYKKTSN